MSIQQLPQLPPYIKLCEGNTMIRTLVLQLLDDDEGITENTYATLLDYLAELEEYELLEEINNLVKSCNGRRYMA